MDQEQTANANRAQRRNKPKKKKVRPYAREIIFHQALQNMCGGYYKVCIDVSTSYYGYIFHSYLDHF